MKRIDELDSPLNTATELERYLKKVRDLYRDLYIELEWAAQILQENLSTLPVVGSDGERRTGALGSVNSRVRAKLVADNLRRAAEASKYSGGQAVKTWRQFVKTFAPEIDAARTRAKKPKFDPNA
jgi:hypothetical protein